MIKLQGQRVLILPDEATSKTAGGIYLPDQSRQARNSGLVVLIGDTVDKKFDKRRVLFNKMAEVDMQYEGLDVALVWSHDIIAILD